MILYSIVTAYLCINFFLAGNEYEAERIKYRKAANDNRKGQLNHRVNKYLLIKTQRR